MFKWSSRTVCVYLFHVQGHMCSTGLSQVWGVGMADDMETQ